MMAIDIMPDHSLVIFTFSQDPGLTVHNWLQSCHMEHLKQRAENKIQINSNLCSSN